MMRADTDIILSAKVPNIIGAIQKGQKTGLQALKMRQGMAQAKRQRTLDEILPQALSGNPAARNKASALDPELMDRFAALDEQQQSQVRQTTEEMARAALMVRNAPAASKQEVYTRERERLIGQGIPAEQIPEQYSKQAVDRAIMEATDFDTLIARPDQTTRQRNAAGAGLQPGTQAYQDFLLDKQAPKVQLQEIYDPDSPTGTRFVSEQNALGQAAPGGSPDTVVNVGGEAGPQVGSIPQGFALYRQEDGGYTMRPVPGGPADMEAQQAAAQQQQRQTQKLRQSNVVLDDIGRALDIVDESAIPVTGLGSVASVVPGTPAHNLSSLLDSIKANSAFDRLQQMREASPTGGALGQVSDKEMRLLQSSLGSLEQSQSADQFKYNLKRVANTRSRIINGPGHEPYPAIGQEPTRGGFSTVGAVNDAQFMTLRDFVLKTDTLTLDKLPAQVREAIAVRLKSGK